MCDRARKRSEGEVIHVTDHSRALSALRDPVNQDKGHLCVRQAHGQRNVTFIGLIHQKMDKHVTQLFTSTLCTQRKHFSIVHVGVSEFTHGDLEANEKNDVCEKQNSQRDWIKNDRMHLINKITIVTRMIWKEKERMHAAHETTQFRQHASKLETKTHREREMRVNVAFFLRSFVSFCFVLFATTI